MGIISKGFLVLLSASGLVLYQNCAPLEGTGDSVINSLSGAPEYKTVQAIFNSKCVTCHASATSTNGNAGLASYQAILDSNTMVPGNSARSTLYQEVDTGRMPQNLPMLSSNELTIIRTWIDAGAPDDGGIVANELPVVNAGADQNVNLPAGTLTFTATASDNDGSILRTIWSQTSGPNTAAISGDRSLSLSVDSNSLVAGTYVFELLVEDDFGALAFDQVSLITQAAPPPPTPTVFFAGDINPILQARCVSCHAGANPRGGYSLDSYAGVVSPLRVSAGNAAGSLLYQRVANDEMPQGGSPLSAAEKTLIQTWISEGALDN